LDIWVPPNADVRRLRVEVLLKVGIWYVAPMELRIGEARVPPHGEDHPASFSMWDSDAAQRIDQSATDCLAKYLLGGRQTWTGGTATVRDLVRRSAEQDMAIARLHPDHPQYLWFLAEEGILQWEMQNPAFRWSGAEWYLRVRDWIYRHTQAQ
jgi:hypothetical protein